MNGQRNDLCIIIPARNEARRISATLRDYCCRFAGRATIVVVCNGCADGTADVVRNAQPQYPNLELAENMYSPGKGAAICAAARVRAEPWIGYTDADGSTTAAEFDRLFGILQKRNSDGVIGSRWLYGAIIETRQTILRAIASRAFNMLVRALLHLPYADTQCGAKIFRCSTIQRIVPKIKAMDFAFDIDLLMRLHDYRYDVVEVATRWHDVRDGSKVRLVLAAPTMFIRVIMLALQGSWKQRFARMNFNAVSQTHQIQQPNER